MLSTFRSGLAMLAMSDALAFSCPKQTKDLHHRRLELVPSYKTHERPGCDWCRFAETDVVACCATWSNPTTAKCHSCWATSRCVVLIASRQAMASVIRRTTHVTCYDDHNDHRQSLVAERGSLVFRSERSAKFSVVVAVARWQFRRGSDDQE